MTVESTSLQVRPLSSRERNRTAVMCLLDYTVLPYVTVTPRPDRVYLTVATPADLHRWAHALREEGVPSRLEVSAPFYGLQLWVLHTHTPPGRDRYQAPLTLAAAVPTTALVPAELRHLDTVQEVAAS